MDYEYGRLVCAAYRSVRFNVLHSFADNCIRRQYVFVNMMGNMVEHWKIRVHYYTKPARTEMCGSWAVDPRGFPLNASTDWMFKSSGPIPHEKAPRETLLAPYEFQTGLTTPAALITERFGGLLTAVNEARFCSLQSRRLQFLSPHLPYIFHHLL